jgi:endonuclease-3
MEKAVEVLKVLKKAYPNAKYYLNFKTPLELMVAAILSAQVRDEVVNASTPALFVKYRKAEDYAGASVSDLLKYIKSVSFAGNKAKNIIAACKLLVEKHNGKVPRTIDELTKLPGIGRKTAIVILTNAFDIVYGVVVDTHVIRVSYRLGWTKNTNPDKIEKDLNALIPEKHWKETQWLLKAHGRAICRAPDPFCSKCPVSELCPKAGVKKKL